MKVVPKYIYRNLIQKSITSELCSHSVVPEANIGSGLEVQFISLRD